MRTELKELAEKCAEMDKRMRESSLVQNLLDQTNLSYTERVVVVQLPQKFKVS